jgi:hypothetical protein
MMADETNVYPENFPPCDCWQSGGVLSSLSGHRPDCYFHALIVEAMQRSPTPVARDEGPATIPPPDPTVTVIGDAPPGREVTLHPGPGQYHYFGITGVRRVESFDEVTEALNNGHPPFETFAIQQGGSGITKLPLETFAIRQSGSGLIHLPLGQLAEEFALHSVQEKRPVPAWEKHRLERKPDHDRPERVPVVVWVWGSDTRYSFQPFDGARHPVGVEIPIGWSLVPHQHAGILLRNLWGDELCADDVLNLAQTGSGSFRLASKSVIEPGDATG